MARELKLPPGMDLGPGEKMTDDISKIASEKYLIDAGALASKDGNRNRAYPMCVALGQIYSDPKLNLDEDTKLRIRYIATLAIHITTELAKRDYDWMKIYIPIIDSIADWNEGNKEEEDAAIVQRQNRRLPIF